MQLLLSQGTLKPALQAKEQGRISKRSHRGVDGPPTHVQASSDLRLGQPCSSLRKPVPFPAFPTELICMPDHTASGGVVGDVGPRK